ncbi:hypothetical protein [Butyricimonas sp.]|uniref:hypothetical protein n=1 Tax=Butyricimonas sp. TaxID=1969738 RepID=UPI0025C2740D|nr:hypothetical protein [Butyricimonas sp.]
MKITKLLFSVMLLVGVLYACEKDKSDSKIGLEENKLTFQAAGDSAIVKTENGYWGISEIYETTDTTIIHGGLRDKDTISINWFTTIKMDKDVFVKVDPNNTGEKRKILLVLVKGNDYADLAITQEKNN